MRTLDRIREITPPSLNKRELGMARVAQRSIMESLDRSGAASITITTDNDEHRQVKLPPGALNLIGQLLGAMSEGRAITVMPTNREFTTVEAARFLNVSRPFVIKEIKQGKLKHRMVGTHRRIAFDDLMAYANARRERQAAALAAWPRRA
jgi:excisionase family DNA binding protein